MKTLRPLAALAGATLALSAWAAEPLRMDVQTTFSGPSADTTAMTVTLENDGPDARGAVRVSTESGDVRYPVELPRGARKKLFTLNGANWGELRFTLETDRGAITRAVPPFGLANDQGGSAALIGDDNGGLAFLREQTKEGKRTVQGRDAYVVPEEAPGRPAAYRSFTAVVLGPGAERMTDATVDALKDYTLGGGTLVFLGGASAPVLEDRRWAAALPGHDWQPQTIPTSYALSRAGGADVPGPFTVLVPGALAADAVQPSATGDTFQTERGYGLGRVVVLGYSPLEAPLNVWAGRSRAFSPFIRGGDALRSHQFVESYLNRGLQGTQTYRYGAPGMGSAGRSYYVPSDPFSAKLPPTSTVFGILAGYFVLVVPVSFLLLRKLKRGELAWITAPLLSLGFAGVLFKSAESLYSAALSTASQGVVVLQEGSPRALFFGTSQMFFPRGGQYDLGLRNVDSITSVQNENDFGSDALAGFNPVDVGQVVVPNLEANNLAFREVSYTQRLNGTDWFRMKRIDDARVEVQNRSPYAFSGSLYAGKRHSRDFTLEAGEAKTITANTAEAIGTKGVWPVENAHNFTDRGGRIALSGRLTGFRPGPQIGREVATQSGVSVVAFARERAR